MLTTVTSKGQVTIPKAIRDFLHVQPNDRVEFVVEGGQVVVRPVKTLKDLRGAVTAAGEVKLVTAEMVIAETVWVLESSYGLGTAQVAPLLRGILAAPGLEVLNGGLVARALDHYETLNIDFVDGYIAAVMEKQGIEDLYSFDKKHASVRSNS